MASERRWSATWTGALLGLLTACGVPGPASVEAGRPSYRYFIDPPPAGSWQLEVEARFAGAPSDRLVLPQATPAVRAVFLMDGGRAQALALAPTGDAWIAPSCRVGCTVRYSVDLEALSAACRGMDCARRVGGAVLGPASAWLLRPEPSGDANVHMQVGGGDANVRVQVRGGDAQRFATGMRRAPAGGYMLRARELAEASYTAFGEFRRAGVELPGARLDLVLLGPPLSMGDAGVVDWVRAAAGCVVGLFGRFPVDATVFVVPTGQGDEVVFGRVLSLAGASVALLFGPEARPAAMHDDWVVVHELVHLGTPSFVGEAHWLEEGLATYYEPVLRERAGWMGQEALWRHFTQEMPRGLRKDGQPPSLEDRDDIDSTYWGGALFALLADVRIRTATRGGKSLDDVLRAALAQLGDATHEARLADFVRVGDAATGTHVLADLVARVALAGDAVDLDGLWRDLGIQRMPDGGVELRAEGPGAAIREAIAAGGRH